MLKDITTALRPAIGLLLMLTIITGIAYPLTILALGQALFPAQANGSLVRDPGPGSGAGGERVVGSALIGQPFAEARYFHPRRSAAGDGYDASASSGSNLGPTSQALADLIGEGVSAARAEGAAGAVPADMATGSGSGLDPHISPDNAMIQAARVANARGIPEVSVRDLVTRSIEPATLGVLGAPHVNVLLLNRQLDAASAARP